MNIPFSFKTNKADFNSSSLLEQGKTKEILDKEKTKAQICLTTSKVKKNLPRFLIILLYFTLYFYFCISSIKLTRASSNIVSHAKTGLTPDGPKEP